MKEYERIIAEGIVPADFLKPQMLCDFMVDEKRKKIWALEIDLLVEFDRVCKKHNLRYYAFGGTILGAVRHNGFIPWDDDIDLAMTMDDYTKLQEVASDFRKPYTLQTPYLDPGSYFSFMKLRNENTTFMSKVFACQKFNQGAFIDIFPLVECPPDKLKEQRARLIPLIMKCSNYMKKGCEDLLNDAQLRRLHEYSTNTPLEDYNNIIKEYNNPAYKDCGFYSHSSFFFRFDEYHFWKKELWDNIVYLPFENITVPVPHGWKEILTEYYGNYMIFPPPEKRISNHADMIIDTEKSYVEYIRKMP